jgi:hypothetical protein
LEENLATLRDGRYPPGHKPWENKDGSPVWQEAIGASTAENFPFGINASTTFEAAKKKCSIEFHVCNVRLDLQLEVERVKSLETCCSLDAFLTRCQVLSSPYQSTLSATVSSLGSPPGLFGDLHAMVRLAAVRMYKLQVESATRDIVKQAEESEKQTKQQQKALDDAAKLTPAEVVGRAFNAFLQKGKRPKSSEPQVDFSKMLDISVHAPTLVDQKNGESPGAARGQNPQHTGKSKKLSQPKAKGGGKGKSTKGKGKGQPQQAAAKGSAKGKGKGKSSPDGANGKSKKSGRGGGNKGKGGKGRGRS